MVHWVDYVCNPKYTPTILKCKKWGSGLIVGSIYKSYEYKNGKYRLWNCAGNYVFASKAYFDVIEKGNNT